MAADSGKKVEYIELIYDLIFVYLIGRSSSLLDRVEAGFITGETFLNYIVSSMIILQIWFFTTLYMNWFGENSVRDKVMILINMILLYFMGANTIHGWDINYPVYMGAWCMILLNLSVHYLLQLRTRENPEWRKHILSNAVLLLLQALYIAGSIPVYLMTQNTLGPWGFLIGLAALPFITKMPTDFSHLTERVMLYVIFTFGDMLLIIAEYFTAGFTFETVYFAVTSVLIVAGLFFSYGYIYDHLIYKSGMRRCGLYMILHVFIIIALSCITTALEFMRDSEVRSLPKVVMMVISLLVYYIGLAMTENWSIRSYVARKRFFPLLLVGFILFAVIMILTVGINGYLTAGIILVFVYVQLFMIRINEKITVQDQ
ncbi:MAG: low temperature requirement protein A [Lachnospiraceae bacterium]|nr:low temperature requirement protein A [Lachnospiraceae bacterium]